MAGIFPEGGTNPGNTLGAANDIDAIALCAVLFYRMGCNPRFDPISTNAVISEIASAINDLGVEYDCSRLDNLSIAIRAAIEKASQTKTYQTVLPDADDLIRGSYDGVEANATVKSLLELAPGILDPVGDIDPNDFVYISRDNKGVKIPLSVFIEAFVSPPTFGANYSWKDLRSAYVPSQIGVAQRNNRDVPIMVSIQLTRDNSSVYISKDGVEWTYIGTGAGNTFEKNQISFILPPGQFYRNDNGNVSAWLELTPD